MKKLTNLAIVSISLTLSAFAQTAYVRSDNVSAVVYEGDNFHIYELSLPLDGSAWSLGDLTNKTGAPLAAVGAALADAGEPSAYVRSDNTNSVVYRASNGHIYEIYLPLDGSAWNVGDLTVKSGNAPLAVMGPVAYRRSDNTNSVVYVGADSHLYEIYLPPSGAWEYGDLTVKTSAPEAVAAPAVYVRSDSTNSVVYRASNGHIYEIYLPLDGSAWNVGDLTVKSGNAPLAVLGPVGYRRSDSVNSVVYVGENSHLYEIYLPLNGSTWQHDDLTVASGTPEAAASIPSAFIRSDGVNSVQYVGANSQVYELYLPPNGNWSHGDITTATDATPVGEVGAVPTPAGYRRSDNTNSMVYCGSDGDIHELYLPLDAPAWSSGNLSAKAGVTGCNPNIPNPK